MLSETFCFSQHKMFSNAVISSPKAHTSYFDSIFPITEINEFKIDTQQSAVLLKNGYAEAEIINKSDWLLIAHKAKAKEIKFIFTKYPAKKELWLTDYYKLLGARLKKLFETDSNLNSNLIKWSIILQTDCKTEPKARLLFHGIEIIYEQIKSDTLHKKLFKPLEVTYDSADVIKTAEQKVEHFIKTNTKIKDSSIMMIFNKHPEWKNSLVVIDFTGSMYQYGGQVLLNHILNFKKSGIKYFVFFNDGDGRKNKEIGKTGGIYCDIANDIDGLPNLLNKVKYMGNGGEKEENNIEAILKGMHKFPDFNEIILIADNNSCMRDYCLIEKIKMPVKVIVCRVRKTINPQYINLAYHTGGSVITANEEINNLDTFKADNQLIINNTVYRYNTSKDRFEYKNKLKYRFHQNCNRFYKKKCECD